LVGGGDEAEPADEGIDTFREIRGVVQGGSPLGSEWRAEQTLAGAGEVAGLFASDAGVA